MDRIVKLVSGGIDSTIMAKTYPGTNVYVDFGQRYAKEEQKALNKLGIVYDAIKIESRFAENDIYINDRNLTFASIVSMIYSPDIIMIAGLKDDNCKDKTEEAFKRISDTISEFANKKIKVVSPYWGKTKGDIIAEYANKEELLKTFSCYNPVNGEPCMNCPACLRKTIALETNGVKTGKLLSNDIIRQYLNKIHLYDSDRISRFFLYLKKYTQVQAIDIDGVLCETNGHDYKNSKPINEAIKALNTKNGVIVLYTARLETDRTMTENWLKKQGVKYDCLIMNKLPYDSIVDDKAKSIKE